ncbi:DUF4259 domain-containing protein [Teredinibacter franksiae]|uniref:DUF4259 domain-containing protein n=1 Tax=Teredinibacter franksiae TaxID=2761453 RepID=UPI001626A50B|nr:DUF4259 domain-containing protein [Teredinibacter franksiae]
MYKLVSLIGLILFPFQAIAGAWGVGAFDNDTALDWVSELSDSDNPLVLFKSAIDAPSIGGYIDADICSNAIAASEIVAIVFNASSGEYSKVILKLAKSLKPQLSKEAVPRAEKAVAICSGESGSELKQLWNESKEWSAYVGGLQHRLKSALNK